MCRCLVECTLARPPDFSYESSPPTLTSTVAPYTHPPHTTTTPTTMRATSSLLKKVAQPNPSPRYAAVLPGGQATASTLRNLVSLHHQSATFMRSPEEIPTVFEQTFRYQRPEYESYASYAKRTRAEMALRGDAGIEIMAERSANGVGARRVAGSFQPARMTRNAFRDPDPYARESNLSEREMIVKETLFGTWERDGGTRDVRPGLDGVLEIAERRGGVKKVAKEWKGQEEVGSTEDGM